MDTKKFKSKTIFTQRNNGDVNETWPIALDIGYSGVKVFSPNMVATFPAYAKRENPSQGIMGALGSEVILYQNLDTGECWTVGENAQDRIDARDTGDSETSLYGRERYASPMFRVLVETGLGVAMFRSKHGDPRGKDIFVQTGLPPKYLKMDADILKDVISGSHHFSLRIGDAPEVEFSFELSKEKIDVMAQPMGTLFSVVTDKSGSFVPEAQDYFSKNVIVFDPGFGTLDIFPIRNHMVGRAETFDNLGMKRVLQDTASVLNNMYAQDISVPAMQKYLGRGTFRLVKREDGKMITKDVAFDDVLSKCSQAVCKEALATLEQVLPLSEFDYLIITGGTSAAWSPMIREYFSGMSTLKIIDGNQNDTLPFVFANVRGYYMYRYNKVRAEEAT